jgi:hypothetical protein
VLRTEPGFETTLSRRRALVGGIALAVFGIAATACSSPPPPPPAVDELETQLSLARHDSELAKAAAVDAPQQIGTALTEVAAERTRHAQALTTEIARLAVNPPSTSAQTTTPTPTPTPTPTNAAAPPPPLADVVRSLKASADSAGELASTSSGYRAGLLGSIAAACTASYSVALASSATAS